MALSTIFCASLRRAVNRSYYQTFISNVVSTQNIVPSHNAGCNSDVSIIPCRTYRKKISVGHLKPLSFDHSGDLVQQDELEPSELLFKYRAIPELDNLPESIKKLFTVEFATSREIKEHRNMLVQDKIAQLVGPGHSYEKEVSYLTVKIRNMIPHVVGDRRNKLQKSYLLERIAKRRKILEYLRQVDYDRFIWLMKELKITYTPRDPYEYHKLSKRAQGIKVVRDEMIELKRKKIREVEQLLEEEKTKFFEYKQQVLSGIEEDIKKYNLDKEAVIRRYQESLKERETERKKSMVKKSRINLKYEEYNRSKKEKKLKEMQVV